MSIKPLSYHGFSLDFLVAGSNREKEGKRPGDIMACGEEAGIARVDSVGGSYVFFVEFPGR